MPWRWAVERTFAWLINDRCHSRDDERLTANRAAMIQISMSLTYQPERTSRRWRSSIIEHRRRAHRRLRLSPSLRREVADMITDAYTSVRRQTASESGLPLETIPDTCPWTAEQVLDDDFFPR